jgi:hypothetical protein
MRLWTLGPMQRSPSLGTDKITNSMPLRFEISHISEIAIYKEKEDDCGFLKGSKVIVFSSKKTKLATIISICPRFPTSWNHRPGPPRQSPTP